MSVTRIAHARRLFSTDTAAGQTFSSLDLSGEDLSGLTLAETQFEDCLLAGTRFRGSDLSGSSFVSCRFFDEPDNPAADLSFANLTRARFERCDLTTAVCQNARAYDLTLSHCQAQGIDFCATDFSLPIGNSDLTAFRAEHCNLAYADFSNTRLKGAVLTDTRLVHALFVNTSLDDAVLSGSDLCNMTATGLSLAGADLRHATFNNIDPRRIDLDGVRVSADQALLLLQPLGVEVDPGV